MGGQQRIQTCGTSHCIKTVWKFLPHRSYNLNRQGKCHYILLYTGRTGEGEEILSRWVSFSQVIWLQGNASLYLVKKLLRWLLLCIWWWSAGCPVFTNSEYLQHLCKISLIQQESTRIVHMHAHMCAHAHAHTPPSPSVLLTTRGTDAGPWEIWPKLGR